MKITLLGTGTPTPSLKRMSSGYMVEVGDDIILFDQESITLGDDELFRDFSANSNKSAASQLRNFFSVSR